MLIIISKIIFALSFLGILFIIFRKLPALSRSPEESFVKGLSIKTTSDWFKQTKKKLILSYFFRTIIIGNLEKSLRKLKILTLKIANILEKLLRKVKKNP